MTISSALSLHLCSKSRSGQSFQSRDTSDKTANKDAEALDVLVTVAPNGKKNHHRAQPWEMGFLQIFLDSSLTSQMCATHLRCH